MADKRGVCRRLLPILHGDGQAVSHFLLASSDSEVFLLDPSRFLCCGRGESHGFVGPLGVWTMTPPTVGQFIKELQQLDRSKPIKAGQWRRIRGQWEYLWCEPIIADSAEGGVYIEAGEEYDEV